MKLGKERPNALFLDMACCVGNDTRKVIADGFPASQVVASDLFAGECLHSCSESRRFNPRRHRVLEHRAQGVQVYAGDLPSEVHPR